MGSGPGRALGRVLNVRDGEGRLVAVLAGHVLLTTAALIVLSATKNGLFLSVYPAEWIPRVIVAAAVVTALFATGFAGLVGLLDRRRLSHLLAGVAIVTLVVGRAAFAAAPELAFVLYLWLSVVGVLAVTQAWGTVNDLLTGRQAKRLLPLVAAGGSAAGVLAGFGVGPAALAVGTPNLLLVAAGLLGAATALLHLAPKPATPDAARAPAPAAHSFGSGIRTGFGALSRERLLRIVTLAVVLTVLISTTVDYQFKAALQAAYDRDAITALYGAMEGAVGLGAFLLQLTASRFLFRRFGLSLGSLFRAGTLGTLAAAALAFGGFWLVAALRFADDVLRFGIQKTVEQVSYTPFPARLRNPAHAAVDGVVKPLAKAAAGGLLVLLAPRLGAAGLSLVTLGAAGVMAAVFLRYRPAYLEALEGALARCTLDLAGGGDDALPLLDRSALAALDRAIEGDDPAILVFAASLLRNAPRTAARERLVPLLSHPVPEVRAEAAGALLEVEEDARADAELEPLRRRLAVETEPRVLRVLLEGLARAGAPGVAEAARRFTEHPAPDVRRAALVVRGRPGRHREEVLRTLAALQASGRVEDRRVALEVAAELRASDWLEVLVAGALDPATRSAALRGLAALGAEALTAFDALLEHPELDADGRRAVVAALADVEHEAARTRLAALLDDPRAGGAAASALARRRRRRQIPALDAARVRPALSRTAGAGLRYVLLAEALRAGSPDERRRFVADELEARHRAVVRQVLELLALCYAPDRLEAIGRTLFARDPAVQGHALELLDGILEPEDARWVLPLVDADRRAHDEAAVPARPDRGRLRARPLEVLATERDPWLQACAAFAAGGPDGGHDIEPSAHASEMIPLLEKVLFLKGSSLFQALSGEELAGVARVTHAVHLREGEVLFREGDPGDAFYLVVSGRIRIERGGREIAVLGPREGLGEMAILDGEPRSATAVAAEASTLLRIGRTEFDALVERSPALARGIYRVLSRRLRSTLAQVSGQAGGSA